MEKKLETIGPTKSEEISSKKFPISFLTRNQQNHSFEQDIIQQPHMELIHKKHEVATPPQWTRHEYVHTPFVEYIALPLDAIVALDTSS